MKKTLLILGLFILFSEHAIAQKTYATDKGSVIVAGSASYVSQGGDMRGSKRAVTYHMISSIQHFIIPS